MTKHVIIKIILSLLGPVFLHVAAVVRLRLNTSVVTCKSASNKIWLSANVSQFLFFNFIKIYKYFQCTEIFIAGKQVGRGRIQLFRDIFCYKMDEYIFPLVNMSLFLPVGGKITATPFFNPLDKK